MLNLLEHSDTSVSWQVIVDDSLIAVATPSSSYISYNDPEIEWEFKSVEFTATDTSHLIKFLVFDDDTLLGFPEFNGELQFVLITSLYPKRKNQ